MFASGEWTTGRSRSVPGVVVELVEDALLRVAECGARGRGPGAVGPVYGTFGGLPDLAAGDREWCGAAGGQLGTFRLGAGSAFPAMACAAFPDRALGQEERESPEHAGLPPQLVKGGGGAGGREDGGAEGAGGFVSGHRYSPLGWTSFVVLSLPTVRPWPRMFWEILGAGACSRVCAGGSAASPLPAVPLTAAAGRRLAFAPAHLTGASLPSATRAGPCA